MKQDETFEAVELVRVYQPEMENEFCRVLEKIGFSAEKARTCAGVFSGNSLDGVYTHGVNRFARFVQHVQEGYVLADKEPVKISGSAAIEQWDGNLGPGPLNALIATDRAMKLANQHGLGCVALANTNHWMRGGCYGWKAARHGFVFIGWTNTIANMPAWKAADNRLGNNPLVIAVPHGQEAIVLDMAMSQYSVGAIELHQMRHRQLDVPGGYDEEGNLTKDPVKILQSKKGLPIGYWKGAGLSLLLDILATILSGGSSTSGITARVTEYAVSQVFMAIDITALANYQGIARAISEILANYQGSVPSGGKDAILYPGERVLATRKENMEKGIPVLKSIWEQVKGL